MSVTKTFPFTTPSNYTYDSNLVEITGGVGRLKSLMPVNSAFYASYTNNENGNWGEGTLAGTLTGGATVSGGALNLSGNAYCQYDDNIIASLIQTGCVRVRFQPHYTGNAPSVQLIFQGSASTTNSITLRHNSNLMQCFVYAGGTAVAILSFGFSAVAETIYELELNFDMNGGNHRVFLNGTLEDTDTGTGTRGACQTYVRIGDTSGQDMSILDVLCFNTVQHTSNYTPDWTGISETKYSIANPTIQINDKWYLEALEGFTETSTLTGSDAITWLHSKDLTNLYYSGGWIASDGSYAQSTSAAITETNKATFTTSKITYGVKLFLYSGDGSTTPEIDLLSIAYNYAGETKDTINKCVVSGYTQKGIGSKVKVYLENNCVLYKNNVQVFKEIYYPEIDALNYWEIELIETVNMQGDQRYIFELNGKKFRKKVPNEQYKELNLLED